MPESPEMFKGKVKILSRFIHAVFQALAEARGLGVMEFRSFLVLTLSILSCQDGKPAYLLPVFSVDIRTVIEAKAFMPGLADSSAFSDSSFVDIHRTPLTARDTMHYIIHWTDAPPSYQAAWTGGSWNKAETIRIDRFHPRSSEHRPETCAKLLYDDQHLYLRFQVKDRYVKAVHTKYQAPVCEDSCVEFFLRPSIFGQADLTRHCPPHYRGYFNFELNCIGTMLLYYIEDWQRTDQGFAQYTPVDRELSHTVGIFPSLSGVIETEIDEPLEWTLGCTIPFSLFEQYLGPLNISKGKPWRGNFYKCADRCSHPHWAAWAPIGDPLNFHEPSGFGSFDFGE
jgi:hypothetical protein